MQSVSHNRILVEDFEEMYVICPHIITRQPKMLTPFEECVFRSTGMYYRDDWNDVLTWCEDHTTMRWGLTSPTTYCFESKYDAALFKLFWS